MFILTNKVVEQILLMPECVNTWNPLILTLATTMLQKYLVRIYRWITKDQKPCMHSKQCQEVSPALG